MNGKRESISGIVKTIYYSDQKFSAGILETPTGDSVKFAGKVFVRKHDAVRLEGYWVNHPKYGRQFGVESMGYDLKMDPNGLAKFLANHPGIKGIGPVKARLIADAFGRQFDAVIRRQPEEVAKVAKMPLSTALELQRIWTTNSNFNAAMTYLSAFDLTYHQVATLVGKFGSQVVPILKKDPYILIREVPGFGFKRVDKIARNMGTPKNLPSRIRAGLYYCVQEALDNGDCWVEYEDLLDRANNLLVMDDLNSRDVIEGHLRAMIEDGILEEQLFERHVVADPEIYRMEAELAAIFKEAARLRSHIPDNLGMLIDIEGGMLNEEQREAVWNALTYSISLMTGGAGSGKTYTVSTIVKIAEELGLEVVLAAPTGKAAKRLEEVIGHEARTIHRLLGFNGTSYKRDEMDPIDADILVIDEVSMVDIALAWRLFRAVDLERTSVVLVGDHNQLPPVGPGNILRDLVKYRAIPTVLLTKIIRQAGVLKENSTAILAGEVRPTADVPKGTRGPWYVIKSLDKPHDVKSVLINMFENRLAERLGYDLIRDVQVLTPTHKGELGTIELNIAIQCALQKKLRGFSVPEVQPGHRPTFYIGDKVIQTKNDYELGIMNGTIGYVVEPTTNDVLAVEFDGEIVEIKIESEAYNRLQLAYACSVHKVQGSEFPCVIVIAHRIHSFIHHRNLLYTAVTRAKETVIILGDRWGIKHCAEKLKADKRNTFLSLMLGKEVYA